MNDQEEKPVETQRAYDMIHRDATAHIASMKARQWTITHYALILLGVAYYLTSSRIAEACLGKTLLTFGIVGIVVMWLVVIDGSTRSIADKRKRLNRLYDHFDEAAKAVYGEIKKEREGGLYDLRILISLGTVVLAGAIIDFTNVFTGLFNVSHP